MIVVPYTFQCKELLFVLGRMLPPPELSEHGTMVQAAGQLANTLAREVTIVDDQELLVALDDPVEAVSIARELELRVERGFAAPLALDLLRESGEPARQAWAWLRQQLGFQADPQRGVVKLRGLGRTHLPPNIDQIPDVSGALLWIVGGVDQVVFANRLLTIGRNGDIAVDDERVSNIHAAIAPHRGTWAIVDRNSTNGTFVDDRRCTSRCLVPGMTIRIGGTNIIVLSVR